jgi:hypothetical protein
MEGDQAFQDKYSKGFDTTGGMLMESFLGLEVKQSDNKICLHLDKYIKDIVVECSEFSAGICFPHNKCTLFP